jgi:hypothetical protein
MPHRLTHEMLRVLTVALSLMLTSAARGEDPLLPVTGGLVLWLKADAGVTTAPDSGEVTLWADQLAGDNREANHAAAPSEEARPLRIDKALGGKPVIRFDGRDDRLDFNLPVNGLEQLTIFLVAANTTSQDPTWAAHHHGAIGWVHTGGWGTVGLGPFQECVAARMATTRSCGAVLYRRPSSIGPAFSITSAHKNGTAHELCVDGQKVWAGTLAAPSIRSTSDQGSVGCIYHDNPATDFYHGDIAEVLVYATALSEVQRQAVERYLRDRWFGVASQAE